MLLGLAMGCSDDATGQTGRDDHGATGATSVGPGTDGGSTSDGETTSSSLETGDDADSSGSTGGPEVGCPPGADDCVELPLHQLLELRFVARGAVGNPFDTYLLRLRVTSPAGVVRELDGFFDGDGTGGAEGNVWVARLTCDELGSWTWETIEGDAADAGLLGHGGEVMCMPSGDRGGLRRQGRHFALASGDPIYLVGNFLDFTGGLRSTHVYMSEDVSDMDRAAILSRQADFHTANKANLYFANVGDYGGDAVTPWVGAAGASDRSRMDLGRWALYDGYLRELKDAGLLAEMWFFADDSAFGDGAGFSLDDHQRLLRYAMARSSAFPHTAYVIALEWQEGFSQGRIEELGQWLAAHDPWERLLSVHSLTGSSWAFAGSSWPGFVATQAGNSTPATEVNAYGISIRSQDDLPHLDEEFGILGGDVDDELRARTWANLASGAAGGGTGSGLAAMQSFLASSRMPFQSMEPHNELVTAGGSTRYCLAEPGHHYLVYSTGGGFDLVVEGTGLEASWFDPRDAGAARTEAGPVAAGNVHLEPPGGDDWVLYVGDGTGLNDGITHPSPGLEVIVIEVG
ncbi:MAG: DUF5060 domain-containing protein [Myxococcales bacterium]|nr:DUF5060 domain-containing protein [Myxococcales bacterium]MCB9715077.1 DUF5060 domain-containing protein [Myxococcales bacterium]